MWRASILTCFAVHQEPLSFTLCTSKSWWVIARPSLDSRCFPSWLAWFQVGVRQCSLTPASTCAFSQFVLRHPKSQRKARDVRERSPQKRKKEEEKERSDASLTNTPTTHHTHVLYEGSTIQGQVVTRTGHVFYLVVFAMSCLMVSMGEQLTFFSLLYACSSSVALFPSSFLSLLTFYNFSSFFLSITWDLVAYSHLHTHTYIYWYITRILQCWQQL